MLKLKKAIYRTIEDNEFPNYWKATNEEIEKAIFEFETYEDEEHIAIVSFEDLKEIFESFTEEEKAEYFDGIDFSEYTVYDYIADCRMNSLWVIKGIEKIENN